MTRLTNEQFMDKTVNEIKNYATEHPAEGVRVSKLLAKTSAECLEMYMAYQLQRVMKLSTPPSLQEE